MATKKYVVSGEQEKTFHNRRWELERQFREGNLDPEMTNEVLQWLIEGKPVQRDFTQTVLNVINAPAPVVKTSRWLQRQIAKWQKFWTQYGVIVGLSDLKIPAKVRGFDRLLVIPKGMTIQQVIDLRTAKFEIKINIGYNLNDYVIHNDRDANRAAYAIWLKDCNDADIDPLANHLPGITLLERLVYELKYFEETGGEHLDLRSQTLCSGSRTEDGYIPSVTYGEHDQVVISFEHPKDRSHKSRVRTVIANPNNV